MNYKAVYETVRNHLLKQDEASYYDLHCAYRGENGLKCAIGILIPDEMYVKEMEGKSASFLLIEFPEFKELMEADSKADAVFLDALQSIHDHVPTTEWEQYLKNFAEQHDLEA